MDRRRWLSPACNLVLTLALLAVPFGPLLPARASAQRTTYTSAPPSDAQASSSLLTQSCIAPTILDVSGPDTVVAGTTNTYTATVASPHASLPITFTWQYAPELAVPVVQVVNGTQTALDLTSTVTGTRPITVTAHNCGGQVTTVGEVVVQATPLPDLIVTAIWQVSGAIHFQIRNIGQGAAGFFPQVHLEIDGAYVTTYYASQGLAPGERLEGYFLAHWSCSGTEDAMRVSVSSGDDDEEDEYNNTREALWRCDTVAPQRVSGPSATVLHASAVLISWETDEDSDSEVLYGKVAGEATWSLGPD